MQRKVLAQIIRVKILQPHLCCVYFFFPTKPLGCYGDGGAIFTSDEQLAKKLRQIARHGQKRDTIILPLA